MARELLGDPKRLALWNALDGVRRAGVTAVHRLAPADGLPLNPTGEVHWHSIPTIALCLSGVIRIQARTTLDLHAGEAVVVEPGCCHQHLPHRGGATSFALGFLAGRCDVLFFDHQEVLWGMVPEAPYRGWCERLLEAPAEERIGLVQQCLAQVLDDRASIVDWMDPAVLRMAAFLWNHLHRRITASDIVAAGGLARTRAFALFHAFFDQGPGQELMAQRLAIARHLVRRGVSVTETAERCGFAGRADLTRACRRRFGHPPRAWVEAG